MKDTEKNRNGRWNSAGSEDKNIDIPSFMNGGTPDPGWNPYQSPQEEEPEEVIQKEKKHIPKKVRNKGYVRIAYLFSLIFLTLAGYLAYFNVKLIDEIRQNPNNTKGDAQVQYVTRGTIYSADGEALAGTNVDDLGDETRVYPYGNMFAHIVGYSTNGKSGLEAIYNNELMTSNSSIQEMIGSEVSNQKLRGDSLILTLDTRLQRVAYRSLGAYNGAVVVMEAKTGKILAMVSKPDFDPNYIESNWEMLNSDDSGSPLLNRATQGLYPPGSTFKILTVLEYIRENPLTYGNYEYNCEGVTYKDDVKLKCYDYEVHGYEDLKGSFQHSCNTSFANIGLSLDIAKFRDFCESMMFNGKLPTVLPYSESQFRLQSGSSDGDIMTTSIGQGDTLVSPFHMALITAAIANNGNLMYPYVVDKIENFEGILVKQTKPILYQQLISAEEAGILQDFMVSVVEGGTASALSGRNYTAAGKTGSAEYEVGGLTGDEANFSTHSWFVGYSNVEDPDIVVSVIAENGGTGSFAAVPIARDIFDYYYDYIHIG